MIFSYQLLFLPHAFAEKVVKVVTLPNYAPLCFHKEGHNEVQETIPPSKKSKIFTGLAFEILLESFQAEGYTVNLNVVPWKQAMVEMDSGSAGLIFPASKNPERLKKYYFSSELSYPPNSYLLYENSNSSFKWNGLNSLKGKNVGIIRGFSYGKKWAEFVKKGTINLRPYNKMEQIFKVLELNRIDAMVGYLFSYEIKMNAMGIRKKFKSLPPFDESKSFVMGKQNQKVKTILNAFDRGRKKIRKNRALNSLMDKFGFGHIKDF